MNGLLTNNVMFYFGAFWKPGVVYHFYCATGDQGRVIALATSKDMRK